MMCDIPPIPNLYLLPFHVVMRIGFYFIFKLQLPKIRVTWQIRQEDVIALNLLRELPSA